MSVPDQPRTKAKGTVKPQLLRLAPAGIGGNGAARITVSTPAWSMAALPEDWTTRTPDGWPPDETVNCTWTSPESAGIAQGAAQLGDDLAGIAGDFSIAARAGIALLAGRGFGGDGVSLVLTAIAGGRGGTRLRGLLLVGPLRRFGWARAGENMGHGGDFEVGDLAGLHHRSHRFDRQRLGRDRAQHGHVHAFGFDPVRAAMAPARRGVAVVRAATPG